jgi:hypothetical protein
MLVGALVFCTGSECQEGAGTETATEAATVPFPCVLQPADAGLESRFEAWLATGRERVEAWFGKPFPEAVTVLVHPDRAAFTASFPAEWGLTDTQCWMVAYGVADRLSVLSPRVWRTEACEHDPDDEVHVQGIVTHELVHAFHGQHNVTRDFTGIEEAVGWFGEGLGVLVSGQLDDERLTGARRAVAEGRGPVRLTEAWSGPDRYGICGSLVAFLAERVGRDGVLRLLAATSLEEFLEAAGLDEPALLDAWRASLLADES